MFCGRRGSGRRVPTGPSACFRGERRGLRQPSADRRRVSSSCGASVCIHAVTSTARAAGTCLNARCRTWQIALSHAVRTSSCHCALRAGGDPGATGGDRSGSGGRRLGVRLRRRPHGRRRGHAPPRHRGRGPFQRPLLIPAAAGRAPRRASSRAHRGTSDSSRRLLPRSPRCAQADQRTVGGGRTEAPRNPRHR